MSNHRANDSRIAHEIANKTVAIYVRDNILGAIHSEEALMNSVEFDVAEVAQEKCGQFVKDAIVWEAIRLALATLTAIKEATR